MISAPDASWASFMTSMEEYLPVPTMSRDVNSLPPRTRLVSYIVHPPPIGRTISTRSPSWRLTVVYWARGITSRFTATAVYSRLTPRAASSPSTFSPSATSIDWPLTVIRINENDRPRQGAAVTPSHAMFPSLGLSRSGSRGPGPHPVLRNPPPTANTGEYITGADSPRPPGRPRPRQTASVTALTAVGFSSAERSPGSWPRNVARMTRRMILALRVLGRSRTNSTRSGRSAFPMCCATRSVNSPRSASDGVYPDLSTAKQTTASPLTGCGTPIVADSATAGWPTSTDSTSAGPRRLPAIFSVSSDRPCKNQKPSASTYAQSPCTHTPGQRDQYVSS